MSAALLLLGVWVAHYGYYRWPDTNGQQWAQYVGTHALVTLAMLMLIPQAGRAKRTGVAAAGLLACWWGAIESGQAAVCGVVRWGSIPQADICIEAMGHTVYTLATALAVASMIVVRCLRRWRHG